MSMVFSRGTEVNKDLTSDDTMLNPCSIHSFSTLFVRSLVLLIMYSEYGKGDNAFARYFAKWQLAVPIFDTIGQIGRSWTVPLIGSLCNFAVP